MGVNWKDVLGDALTAISLIIVLIQNNLVG